MREIEFRGKGIRNNIWVYGDLKRGLAPEKVVHIFDYTLNIWVAVIPETVGQYVMRKDKNKKKIYRGDIVRVFDLQDNYIIEYNNELAAFCTKHGNIWFPLPIDDKEIEVVGNKYDNPELLES